MRVLVALFAGNILLVGCGGSGGGTSAGPAPTPVATTTTVSGEWTGSASDSTAQSTPHMMGQSGMGRMTWQLTQTGAKVTGSVTFSGMPHGMFGTFTGTMDADDMVFMLNLPMGTMMSGGCGANAKGTVHVDRSTMTMAGTYAGSNTCSGPFVDGHMMLVRR